jgi:hypothetical protein
MYAGGYNFSSAESVRGSIVAIDGVDAVKTVVGELRSVSRAKLLRLD